MKASELSFRVKQFLENEYEKMMKNNQQPEHRLKIKLNSIKCEWSGRWMHEWIKQENWIGS